MTRQVPMKHIAYLLLLSSPVAYAVERSNIIYIFTDQHTANVMSYAGNLGVHTLNLGRLTAAGIMFQNACCTAPLNGLPRDAMSTEHYPGLVELLINSVPLPEALQTQTPGVSVENAGHECAYDGKWHVSELDTPDEVCRFDQTRRHSDDGLTGARVQFLSCEHDEPFFLATSYDNSHNIREYVHSQNFPYGNMEMPGICNCSGPFPDFAENPYDVGATEEGRDNNFNVYPIATFTPEDWRTYRYTYHRLVEKVDHEIGKIIDVIDKNNLWKNTVVISSGDHGDGANAHHWNQKPVLYEEVINISPTVTLPGKEHAGEKLPQLTSSGVDFSAIICDWTGVEKPKSTTGESSRRAAEEGNL